MTNREYLKTLNDKEKYEELHKWSWDSVADGFVGALVDFIKWLESERTVKIKLTPEERKAAELAVATGLPWISYPGIKSFYTVFISSDADGHNAYGIEQMPNMNILSRASWIKEAPQDLRKILEDSL